MRIGIIGGVGPKPTADLYRKIVDSHRNLRNGKFPEVVIYSLPIDSVIEQRMISGETAGPVVDETCRYIENGFNLLENADVEYTALACSTLSYYGFKIRQKNIIDPVHASVFEAIQRGYKKVALLATQGTINLGWFEELLIDAGISVVIPSIESQQFIVDFIINSLHAPSDNSALRKLIEVIRELNKEVDATILGCTDLTAVKEVAMSEQLEVLDSLSSVCSAIDRKVFNTFSLNTQLQQI